jgi:hypothetical protein
VLVKSVRRRMPVCSAIRDVAPTFVRPGAG